MILLGTPTGADATVYQLTADSADRVAFYRRVTDHTPRLLDREQRDIESGANYTLTRVGDAAAGG